MLCHDVDIKACIAQAYYHAIIMNGALKSMQVPDKY